MAARWYVIHVYSGFEKKVMQQIFEQAEKKDLSSQFEEILVPTEQVVEIKKGEKVEKEQQFFPGYILAKMNMNDENWHLVKNIPKVTGFLGTRRPSPISQKEVDAIVSQVKEGKARPVSNASFDVGEQVRVCDGPFSSFNGYIEEVDQEKARLKVTVSIFGRSTPVDLEFSQVEKIK